MLRSLHIENYVLIDSLDATFPEGLIIITGQTGAGKSILLGALSLLTGAKADAGVISENAESCIVEGEFEVKDDSIREALEEADVEWGGGILTIRRVVHSSGRSRSFVNDCPVNVTLLSDIASKLVDIHSQHQSLLLSNRKFQLDLLDNFASVDKESVSASWAKLSAATKALSQAREQLARLDSDRDYNQAQWDQLDSAKLDREDEIEALEQEQKTLSNAEEIKVCLTAASGLFSPEYGSDNPDLCATLKEAGKLLDKASRFLPNLSGLLERMESCRLELEDIRSEIDDANFGINLSQERLEQVDERLSLLYRLLQKHNCRTIAELKEIRDKFSEALFDSSALEQRIDTLQKELTTAQAQYDEAAKAAAQKRRAAAPKLAASILEDLHFLDLDRAAFDITLEPCQPGPQGTDAVSFLFSSTGSNLTDVSKCASGGEISRIMLCLKALMASYVGMPTMIFDEIDTGVSGSSADKMGQMICKMGKDMQVFAITHLPQVAAKGSAHYVVSKKDNPAGRVISNITKLSEEQRVEEIARLLSGTSVTPEALANAKSLLAN